MKKAVVIGAGFAGLMPAHLLREKGWEVTIIEKAGFLGGGVRTLFHGGHPYTFGPRHFLTPYDEAYEFMNKYVPLRDIDKINYTFIEKDQEFYTYPIHEEDIPTMPEAAKIRTELAARKEGTSSTNFEEFWIARVGETLYGKYVKEYNKKAWQVPSNLEVNFGFEATVKMKPLESGDRFEYRDWYNCYPIAHDGYNKYFDRAVERCTVLLNSNITHYEPENCSVVVNGERISGDILISTVSPDTLLNNQYGELKYVGREFYPIVLPCAEVLPKDVYFVYYPNGNETHTRVVEYKKFTQHKSPYTLIGLEVPSLKNKLYPTLIKSEVEKAQRYLDALPKNVYSMGRMGNYRYIDLDDIIMQTLDFMKKI